jgi:CheY-like chemotaxis protein
MGRVLLVDDEPSLRLLLRTALESSGHGVIEAADGHQAIEACAGRPIDVLVCDLFLPDMMAQDVILIALMSNPNLKVLVMSGETEPTIRSYGISDRCSVITKPFELSEFVRIVEGS